MAENKSEGQLKFELLKEDFSRLKLLKVGELNYLAEEVRENGKLVLKNAYQLTDVESNNYIKSAVINWAERYVSNNLEEMVINSSTLTVMSKSISPLTQLAIDKAMLEVQYTLVYGDSVAITTALTDLISK